MPLSTPKFLWVFGNAVQDITVEVDTDRVLRESGTIQEPPIHLGEQGVEIRNGTVLKTKAGSEEFEVRLNLKDLEPKAQRYVLEGGKKYTLSGDVHAPSTEASLSLFLRCENLSWGGGGANVVTFLRSLAPRHDVVPIKYTDIAMSRTLPVLLQRLEGICFDIKGERSASRSKRCEVWKRANALCETNPVEAENITAQMAKIVSDHAPERSLEVYLASLPVECVLYRPCIPRFRRNWVFSRFRSASRQLDNKIILRGSPPGLPEDEELAIRNLLKHHIATAGAFVINSLKDGPLFRAAYSLYKEAYAKDKNTVAILAMTESMLEFTEWMRKDRGAGRNAKFPPLILVFNETEAYRFARQFDKSVEPFMTEEGLINIKKFAHMAIAILREFDTAREPRIYVTLGHRGSLGVDGSGNVVYVCSYSAGGATIYDTNACGDAYCSAIALLEWAKRHGSPTCRNIAKVDFKTSEHGDAEEMLYFMAVATAAAYCRATNRRGRVYAADVKDLLQHTHLSSVTLPRVRELDELSDDRRPQCVDDKFCLREPSTAKQVTVTEELGRLLG